MSTPLKVIGSPKQEALEIVIAELERSLVVLEANYQRAVSNLNVLRQCVDTDDLTRLLRRGAFMSKLHTLLSHSQQHGREVHVLMIDVDHFKRVNDTHGHQTGDAVLQKISGLITEYLRPGDLAGRYGGEELIIAMQSGKLEALTIAENIRKAVEAHSMKAKRSELRVTLSAGIASSGDFGHEVDALIERADAALYRAKHDGRNRVEVAQADEVVMSLGEARAA